MKESLREAILRLAENLKRDLALHPERRKRQRETSNLPKVDRQKVEVNVDPDMLKEGPWPFPEQAIVEASQLAESLSEGISRLGIPDENARKVIIERSREPREPKEPKQLDPTILRHLSDSSAGLSIREIARREGVHPSTIMRRLRRAKGVS